MYLNRIALRAYRLIRSLRPGCAAFTFAFTFSGVAGAQPGPVAEARGWSLDSLHPPLTADEPSFEPRPYTYVEPAPLDLPSDEDLSTTIVEGRHYHIKRVPAGAYDPARETDGARIFENDNEALYFRGTGDSGKHSNERLIVRNCTFVIDFEPGDHPGGDFKRWDPRRGAIVVEGYKEVLIQNCVFVSRATKHDPIRKIIGSIVANYCLKVQIDQSYFEGATLGWRGHILVWGGGPTEITNVEIAGAKQGTTYAMGGGIWVAHGEKIGWTHGGNPEYMIYPNGPLRIENVYIHDQEGDKNTDGIYIQSIQPYLVRNTRVENWKGQDSLVDVGFRDTFQGFRGKRLVNHGAVGVIEHSHFAEGYVKCSVGLAGGLIFRHNIMERSWMFPYVFDGGSWYVLGNRFEDMTGVAVSGRNAQLDGWTPGEGMFARGSQMHLMGNEFQNREGRRLPALFVNNNGRSPLQKVIVADHNTYLLDPMPGAWALEQTTQTRYTLEQWREFGNDRQSDVGRSGGHVQVPPKSLPGGLTFDMSKPTEPGLIGPTGVTDPAVLEKAKKLSAEAKDAYDRRYVEIEFEDMEIVDRTEGLKMAFKPSSFWSGRGTLRIEPEAGQDVTFRFDVPHAGRYRVRTRSVDAGPPTPAAMFIDGKVLDERFNAAAGGNDHGLLQLESGEHKLTFRYLETGTQRLDRLDLSLFTAEQEQREARIEQERQSQLEAKQLAAREREAREAATLWLEAEAMKVVDKAGWVGVANNKNAGGGKYLLLAAKNLNDFVTLEAPIESAGTYRIALTTVAQADAGKVQLEIDGEPVGTPQPLGGRVDFPQARLDADTHRFTLRLVEGTPEIKVRIDRWELIPAAN